MRLSPQWLRDYVDLKVDNATLAHDLTTIGIAAEGISGSGADTVFEMEIGTNRPVFCGRDGIKKYSLAEIEYERRNGYSWYSDRPAKLLNDDYPKWAARIR